VELFDITGHKVYQGLVVNQQEHTLEVFAFSAGVYLLRLTRADGG